MSDHAWGVGIATLDSHGATLDVRFRTVGLGKFSPADAPSHQPSVDTDRDRGVAFEAVTVEIEISAALVGAAEISISTVTASKATPRSRSVSTLG